MNKDENIAYLQSFAEKHLIPLNFTFNDMEYCSFKKIIMKDVDEEYEFMQEIIIEDGSVNSLFLFETDDISDADEMETLCLKLQEKTGFQFDYDRELSVFSTGILQDSDYFEKMPPNKKEAFTEHFFYKPCKLGRLMYEAYYAVEYESLSVDDAIEKATKIAEELGYNFEYKYNLVRELVDKGGPRYYVEHIAVPKIFYSNSESVVSNLIEDRDDGARTLFEFAFDDFDVPFINEFNSLYVEVIANRDNLKCIGIRMPKVQKEFDCSDIILLVFKDDVSYYTIESAGTPIKKKSPGYYLGCWDAEGSHHNLGFFNSRDRAYEVIHQRCNTSTTVIN